MDSTPGLWFGNKTLKPSSVVKIIIIIIIIIIIKDKLASLLIC